MEPERLEPTLAERFDASAELIDEAEAENAGTDDPKVTSETRKQVLRKRMNGLRKRLVIKESQRRWWRPKDR